MDTWLKISLLLCTFGFFRELRPSEPYAAEYLFQWYNLTSEEATKDVYPLGTYSVLAQLVIVFLITDMLRYKPIIIVSACAGIILFCIVNFTRELLGVQIAQFFYGTLMACEVAYYTYIYAKVDKDRYQIVTGHTRAAILCGKFLAGVLAQLILSTGVGTIQALLYISLGSQVVSLVIGISLPAVSKSLYFYSEQEGAGALEENKTKVEQQQTTVAVISTAAMDSNGAATKVEKSKEDVEKSSQATKPKFSWSNASRLLLQHTVSAYSKPIVVQWSIWWSLASCAQVQVLTYVQILWKEIDPNNEQSYNGAVEASVTLLGACGAMAAGLMNGSRHKKWHWWILTVCSVFMGTFLIIAALTEFIILCYAMYILFGIFYFFVITIASATVAEHLTDDSFGLIFGINTLFALVLQTLLTLVVVTDAGLAYGPREQFVVYGGYYIALAALYCVALVVKQLCRYGKRAKYDLD